MTIMLNGSDLTVTQVVAAIELAVAAQALDLREAAPLGLGTGRAYRLIRELIPFTRAEGALPANLEPLVELVARGGLEPLPPASIPAR